jgi:hypothetical protein
MQSLEFIVGIAIILGTVLFSWVARPNATGAARRLAAHPLIEPYYPVILMALFLTSAILIALGLGFQIGQESAATP